MSRYHFPFAMRWSAACVAGLIAILAVHVPPAQAGEVVTTDCLHGSGTSYASSNSNSYADRYGSDHGDTFGTGYSYTRARGNHFGGFVGRHRRVLVTGAADENGGGTINGADAGSANANHEGYTSEYTVGSTSNTSSDSCVEIRHELTNPYVIEVPHAEAEDREAAEHERLWRARCHPVIRQDRYGVNRYVYAASGCEYGRYE